MPQTLALTEEPIRIEGAVSIEVTDAGVIPWRIEQNRRDLYHPGLVTTACMPSGVRLTLVSDSASLALPYTDLDEIRPDVPTRFDLLVDGEFHSRCEAQTVLDEPHRATFENIPAGEHRLEIYLPPHPCVRLGEVEIDDGASAKPWDDDRPRWIAYGSSITHCVGAHGPSETWPALVARKHNLHLTNLGLAGQCHMDILLARIIRDRAANAISLCLGINIMGGESFNERSFREQAIGFVTLIREGQPDTPIVVQSPIYNRPRETEKNAAGLCLVDMRAMLAEAVEKLRAHGDANLHYVDGLNVIGPDQAETMPDELHPNGEGMYVQAERYAAAAIELLGLG